MMLTWTMLTDVQLSLPAMSFCVRGLMLIWIHLMGNRSPWKTQCPTPPIYSQSHLIQPHYRIPTDKSACHMGTWICSVYKSYNRYNRYCFNAARPGQNGQHFADDIFKRIFLNEDILISIDILLNCVPEGQINNIPALVQVMAWRWPDDKPLSEPMMVSLMTHICVNRRQWVNMRCCFG